MSVSFINTIIALLLLYLNWKSSKTEKIIHIIVAVCIIIIGSLTVIENIKKDKDSENLTKQLTEANLQLTEANPHLKILRKDNKELKAGNVLMNAQIDTLILVIDTLSSRLKPFTKLAKLKYPGKSTDAALELFQNDLESTKKRVSSIENRMKNREINEEQRKNLLSELSKINNVSFIYISFDSGNSESQNYASDISSIFTQIGIENYAGFKMGSSTQPGLWILSKDETSDIQAKKISTAFTYAGVECYFARGNRNEDHNINIIIGPKN
jgi:hypothetical protein